MITIDFEIESLGYHFPDYFQDVSEDDYRGNYDYRVIGMGDTEEVALDDALDQVAAAGFDTEQIRKTFDYGDWDCPNGRREGCNPLFYVTIRWNNKRLCRVEAYGLLEYHDYYFDGKKWGYRHTIPPGTKVIDSDLRIKRDEKKESYFAIPYIRDLLVRFFYKNFFWLTKDRMIVLGLTALVNDEDFDDIMDIIEENLQ